MRLTRLRLFSTTLAFFLPHLVGAQRSSPTLPFYDANAGLIKLDVVVTDQAGNPVSAIAAKNITLLDDGKPVKILTFHAHDGTSTGLEDRGRKARQALVALADASVLLDPPPKEIPAAAPPDHDKQQRITSLALEYLNKAAQNLPNFYATRTTIHYQEDPLFEKGDAKTTYQPLHVADSVRDTVFYRNGYEIGESDSGTSKKRKADEPYLVTYGTFGPILRGALDAIVVSHNGLSWKRWESTAGQFIAVFNYAVRAEKSAYDTGGCCLPDGDGTSAFRSRVGYHGEIAIDPATGAILRLELIFDLKSTTPLNRSEIMIEYGPVEIAGKTYICPVKSVSISRGRSVAVLSETLNARARNQWRESFRTYGPYATMLNDITFDSFHLFHADSHMLTGLPTQQ
jgi:hypothetical protein